MPKVNIIGAGMAGLCAGCYLQMNGYDTEIFESHDVPGGLCTAWNRKGYTFDTCIHWLVGSGSSDPLHALWKELVDIDKIKFVDHDLYMQVEDGKGGAIRVFCDADQLEKELLEKAPEDKKRIIELTKAVRKFSRFRMPVGKAPELMTPFEGVKLYLGMAPYMFDFMKWIRISSADYAARFQNPLLRKTIEAIFLPEMAALFLIFTLSWMHKKSAGYPIGGSVPFAKLFEKRYLELGGRIQYRSRVKKIITQGEAPEAKASGLELENGKTHFCDVVVSAADGHATIFDMLGGQFTDDIVRSYYDTMLPFPSYLQVSLGVARTFEKEPHAVVFTLGKPIHVDEGNTADALAVHIHHYDPTLAPKGKTVLTVLLTSTHTDAWIDLRRNHPDQYKAEKERIAGDVMDALEKRFGNVRPHVEAIDVSTPATVVRVTHNWKGSFEGWVMTPKTGLRSLRRTLPGLSNFYMAGQWVEPGGGLPSAIMSGRNVTQAICKKDGKRFRA